jgi:hypothetical protein
VNETVTISMKEYQTLVDSKSLLDCLEAAGVDNWDGYDYARQMYDEDKEDF